MYRDSEFTIGKTIGVLGLLVLLIIASWRFIKLDDAKIEEKYVDRSMVVKWEEVNFRDGPGLYDTHVLATLKRNTKVTATGMTQSIQNPNASEGHLDKWIEVVYEGRTGWVRFDALSGW